MSQLEPTDPIEAAAIAAWKVYSHGKPWNHLGNPARAIWREIARTAIETALRVESDLEIAESQREHEAHARTVGHPGYTK